MGRHKIIRENTLFELITKLKVLKEQGIFEDVAVVTGKGLMQSIFDFSLFPNIKDIMKYIRENNCTDIIIKVSGFRSYSGVISIHRFQGFKLNNKSMVIYNKPIFNGKDYVEQPNNYIKWK